jgi:hypothetical protein
VERSQGRPRATAGLTRDEGARPATRPTTAHALGATTQRPEARLYAALEDCRIGCHPFWRHQMEFPSPRREEGQGEGRARPQTGAKRYVVSRTRRRVTRGEDSTLRVAIAFPTVPASYSKENAPDRPTIPSPQWGEAQGEGRARPQVGAKRYMVGSAGRRLSSEGTLKPAIPTAGAPPGGNGYSNEGAPDGPLIPSPQWGQGQGEERTRRQPSASRGARHRANRVCARKGT